MRRLFGTDGVRGIANEYLSCERAMSIGRALGHVLSSNQKYRPKVVIGMDTRLSSEMLAASISAGLLSVGSDIMNIGVVPTPAVAYLVKKYKAKAGIMISASHNTFDYNGIKIFGEEGYKLSDELEEQIESIVLDNTPPVKIAEKGEIGRKLNAPFALHDYINYLLHTTDVSLDGLKVAIDAACGSASATAGELFTSLGAEIKLLHSSPDGININDGCGSTHLDSLKRFVVENRMDVGIAFDGDADRCLAVDENGCEVDGDFIMAILSLDMKKRGILKKNTVVGTVMSNFGFHKFCEENGIIFIAAKVGDRYVLEMLNQEGFSFGGEQSGHIIFKELATTGDGQLTAIKLLSHIKESGMPLSRLASVMKKYPQFTVNIEASQNEKIALFTDEEIKAIITDAEDKIGDDGRLVIRPSGTEPLIRIMVEGEDPERTERIARETARLIKEKLGGY